MDLPLFFVLPLIGGFAFVTGFLLLRYRTGRQDAQRLYYHAAIYGIALAAIAAASHLLLRGTSVWYATSIESLSKIFIAPLLEREKTSMSLPVSPASASIRADVAIVCVYAFVLGALTPVWNLVIAVADKLWVGLAPSPTRRSFLDRLNLRAITNQLERLIAESLYSASAIQVTLDNSKVYVGVVLESPDPSNPAQFFKIQPWMSGHRSPQDGRVDFNTFYDTVLAGVAEGEAKRRTVASFQLVIPIDKVVSASGFDFEAYEQFVLEQGASDRERSKPAP